MCAQETRRHIDACLQQAGGKLTHTCASQSSPHSSSCFFDTCCARCTRSANGNPPRTAAQSLGLRLASEQSQGQRLWPLNESLFGEQSHYERNVAVESGSGCLGRCKSVISYRGSSQENKSARSKGTVHCRNGQPCGPVPQKARCIAASKLKFSKFPKSAAAPQLISPHA